MKTEQANHNVENLVLAWRRGEVGVKREIIQLSQAYLSEKGIPINMPTRVQDLLQGHAGFAGYDGLDMGQDQCIEIWSPNTSIHYSVDTVLMPEFSVGCEFRVWSDIEGILSTDALGEEHFPEELWVMLVLKRAEEPRSLMVKDKV